MPDPLGANAPQLSAADAGPVLQLPLDLAGPTPRVEVDVTLLADLARVLAQVLAVLGAGGGPDAAASGALTPAPRGAAGGTAAGGSDGR